MLGHRQLTAGLERARSRRQGRSPAKRGRREGGDLDGPGGGSAASTDVEPGQAGPQVGYGPEVKALVKRYLEQMIEELQTLPHPDGEAGTLLDAIDLIIPHQANKRMVIDLAEQAGIGRDRMYFNIARVGNTSAASIPLAIHDAVREGVLSAPTRVFTPGFGAGAVAGYAVLRIDPAVVAPEPTGPPTTMDAGPLLALPHTASSADVEAAFGG